MKHCVSCGLELRDNEFFCGGCGAYQPDTRSLGEEKNYGYEDVEVKVNERNIYTSGYYEHEDNNYEIDLEKDEAVDTLNKATVENVAYKPLACNDHLVNKPKRDRRTKRHMSTFSKVICVIAVIVLLFWAKDRFLDSSDKVADGFLDSLCELKSDKVLEYCFKEKKDDKNDKEENDEVKKVRESLSDLEKYESQYNLSYKINSNKEFSSLDKKDFWENISSETMFITEDNDELKELNLYKVTITKNDLSSGSIENINVELYVGKVKGRWKVVGIDKKD